MLTWIFIGLCVVIVGVILFNMFTSDEPDVVYCSQCKFKDPSSKVGVCRHQEKPEHHSNYYEKQIVEGAYRMSDKNFNNRCEDFEWSAQALYDMTPERNESI